MIPIGDQWSEASIRNDSQTLTLQCNDYSGSVMKRLTLTALCLTSLAATQGYADMFDGTLTLGLGVGANDGVYKGQSTEDFVFPVIEYEEGPLSIGGEGIAYNLIEDEETGFVFIVGAGVSGDSYDSKDASGLKGMSDRHSGFDLGAGLAWDTGAGTLSAMLRQDVSDRHKGQQLDLGYEITLPVHEYLAVSSSFGLSYLSKDYVDYYFGVRNSEATADRAAYKGDGTMNTHVGLSLVIPVTDRWNIINANTYTWFGDEIADSPIVRKDKIWTTTLMTTYTF